MRVEPKVYWYCATCKTVFDRDRSWALTHHMKRPNKANGVWGNRCDGKPTPKLPPEIEAAIRLGGPDALRPLGIAFDRLLFG